MLQVRLFGIIMDIILVYVLAEKTEISVPSSELAGVVNTETLLRPKLSDVITNFVGGWPCVPVYRLD